jgi:hypothetical protein
MFKQSERIRVLKLPRSYSFEVYPTCQQIKSKLHLQLRVPSPGLLVEVSGTSPINPESTLPGGGKEIAQVTCTPVQDSELSLLNMFPM